MVIFNKRQKDFLDVLQAVLITHDGKKLFKYLIEDYVLPSVRSNTVEHTYYRLGQKELIQALLQDAKLTEEDLNNVITGDRYE